MRSGIKFLSILVLAASSYAGCKKGEILNPNAPTAEEIVKNPTINELGNLVTGSEAGIRKFYEDYIDYSGVISREYYRFSSSEPRWTNEMLGRNALVLDNKSFYANNSWLARYNVIRNCYLLIEGAKNSTFLANEEQRKGYYGFAKTIIAHQMLVNLNSTGENGIRTNVQDFKNLGPIVGRIQALTDIAALLDAGKADLAGAEVLFHLSTGFEGFDDAAGLLKFNRALAARVAIYRGQWAPALQALNESFYNQLSPFGLGVYQVFSSSTGDQLNQLFVAQNQTGEIRVAHPSYSTDIEAGDDRINKTSLRTSVASSSGLTSNRDMWLYRSNTAAIPIITNEELILIYAEAKIQLGAFGDAVTALHKIRTTHNLQPYSGALTMDALINEMLKQRRYSLFGEGHRWVDLRRYNRLAALPVDRTGDDVWAQLPLPLNEN